MKHLLLLPLLLGFSVPATAHNEFSSESGAQHNNHSTEVEEGRLCPAGFKTVDGMECVQICPPAPKKCSLYE